MSKYAPLGEFLRSRTTRETPLTFAEVERILGFPLPPRAQHHPAWWSNNPSNNTMTKVWLEAGFRTERVDITGRKLVFVKVADALTNAPSEPREYPFGRTAPQPHLTKHPAIGAMKGTIRIAPGVDLTEPAYPEWADIADSIGLPEAKER